MGKNTLIYNGVKKGKFAEKIPIKIIRNTSYGYYLIEVNFDYKKYNRNLTIDEEYVVDYRLLKKINPKTWNSLIIRNEREKTIDFKNSKK